MSYVLLLLVPRPQGVGGESYTNNIVKVETASHGEKGPTLSLRHHLKMAKPLIGQ